ncbi:DSBA-like thioredoxin domain-containing protein 1 [Elsinoe australis]|uniref:Glutathione S-transferase kappa n=1 Tax=Elsinoe australis TaxID=40998 RepID=A0A4U7B8Y1_9PEZI|nr:DSBA-like thioredoxin domain-containing protein 1 [Elsinoe australis]
MARPKLTIYLDAVSPFGYLAFYTIYNSALFKQCDVKYVPILLGGVMKACNNTPPLRIKNKDKFINKDRLRWAKSFNIPISETTPEGFPTNTVSVRLIPNSFSPAAALAPPSRFHPPPKPHAVTDPPSQTQRALAALELASPDKLGAAFAEVYKAYWVEGKPVEKPEVFGPALERAVGKELAKKAVDALGSAEAKSQLSKNTDKALADGAFGMPWYMATNAKGETEGFFGFDHLGQVIEHLGLERGDSLRSML